MYKVGIIGLGAIAAKYSTPTDESPYCHAGGILRSEKVDLAAVAEISEANRDEFRQTWGGAFNPDLPYFDSAAAMLAEVPLDIVAVCVKGPWHFEVMQEVLKAAPRSVFLEKPPTCSLEEQDAIMREAGAKNIAVTGSYSRHWAPHTLRMQELVRDGLIGEVKTVIGYNGKFFLSFASHTTDLICQFAGYQPRAVTAHGHIREQDRQVPAGYEPEPHLDNMLIEFGSGVLGMQVGASNDNGQFYVDVFGTEGRARVGMYFPPMAWNSKGEPIDLAAHGVQHNTSVFQVAYDQIARHLEGGPLPDCTNDDMVAVNEIGFAGIESALTGQRIELPNRNRTRRIFANG